MDRTTVRSFSLIVLITTVVAVAAITWFGPAAHIAGHSAEFGRSRAMPGVWVLLTIPALLTGLGLVAAVMVSWTRLPGLSPDAERSLSRYRSIVRRFFIGVGVLGAVVQGLAVARTAGLALPVGIDLRGFYFSFGALLAYAGNVMPKFPYTSDKWFSAAEFAHFYRFAGWVFVCGGILMCLFALLVAIESLQSVTWILILTVIGLPVLNGILMLGRSRIARRC